MKLFICIFAFFFYQTLICQDLSSRRMYHWDKAGLEQVVSEPSQTLNVKDYGATGDGQTDDAPAFIAAINACNCNNAVITVPEGTFYLKQQIGLRENCKNLIFRGISDKSVLNFDISITIHDCFMILGAIPKYADSLNISQNAYFNDKHLIVKNPELFELGKSLRISLNSNEEIQSDWAKGCIGMVNDIVGTSGDTVFLKYPLSLDVLLTKKPLLSSFTPIENIGIECLKINRINKTLEQTSNVLFRYAKNCWMKNVESYNTNFAHVDILMSKNIQMQNCYFHHAHDYGDGGKGYGVSTDWSSCLNLVENNIFASLRHGIVIQAGANSNVYSYNYVTEPNNAFLGDIVLHGTYPFGNLIEGNSVNSIVVDNSHYLNGPNNVLLRNHSYGLGIICSSSPVTDSLLVLGNHLYGTGLSGLYQISGTGTVQEGNLSNDAFAQDNSKFIDIKSLYMNNAPNFWGNTPWPAVGNSFAENIKLPAKERYHSAAYTDCSTISVGIDDVKYKSGEITDIEVYHIDGQLLYSGRNSETPGLKTGIYIIRSSTDHHVNIYKILIK